MNTPTHVKDILTAYQDGRMSREELIEALVHFPYVTPQRYKTPPETELDDPGPYNEPNTWDEVTHAAYSGALDMPTYREINRRLGERGGGTAP